MPALAEAPPGEAAQTLRNPHPIADYLPGVYREAFIDERLRTNRESFGSRFLGAFDAVLAPVLASLDNLEAYLDPDTTPDDFLDWLATWVAAAIDGSWDEGRRRSFVAQAAELYRRRGTAAGLRDHVAIQTGGLVEIIESGASAWSTKADGKLPGSPEPVVVVRVTVEDPATIDPAKLDALVRGAKPAHVVHRVEVLAAGSRGARRARPGEAADAAAAAAESETAGGPGSSERSDGEQRLEAGDPPA
jgi:phage tail-like protein